MHLAAHAACRAAARAPVKFFSHLPARCPDVLSFIPLSGPAVRPRLVCCAIGRPLRKPLLKHRNSQKRGSHTLVLTSCCCTHDNPTCAHSTPAQHWAVTGAVFTVCMCAWRASALSFDGSLMHARSVMLSQTAHQECLWRVRPSRVHYSSTRVIRLAAARQCPFISPVPVRLSHAAGPAVRIPCLCMLSPCPLSSPSLDFSPIAFRPASCGARLAPHATFEPDLYDKL